MDWTISKNNFLPVAPDKNPAYGTEEFLRSLNKFISIPYMDGKSLSLSLSGGMDSRVLLSFLLKYNKSDCWNTHTFGSINNPDVIIANEITAQLNIDGENFAGSIPSIEDCIKDLRNYCGQTLVSNEASAVLQLNNYEFLRGRSNTVVIDGGFGEIWRREFFNRLLIKGKNSLLNREYETILNHLKILRADIFTDDINKLMASGCKEQIESIFEDLPDINQAGVENWLDSFAIKTRLLNFYSHEQSRLDNMITSYMPFIQIPLLNFLFVTPIKLRKNAKLFREVINNNYSLLSKYWLAKGNTTHPFLLTTLQSRIWNILSKKIGINRYTDNSKQTFILYLKDYINDLINSKDVKESGYYNYKKLQRLSGFLEKEGAADFNTQELDWWLSFEIFRQQIRKV